ncbi:MAG: hypothetical protein ABSD62_03310 [Candidatus Limnocylindrales bacterium]
MVRRRATTLALSGLLALAAVLTAFAGSALATSPNTPVLVTDPPIVELTDPPTASPTATVDPSATPCIVLVEDVAKPAIEFCATPSPVITPDPCATLSVTGAPNAPAQSVCPSPFESFQGETATPVRVTPPPTSTAGSSSGNSTPLVPLLICLVMGALGLTAVTAQRRTMRR